MRSCTSAKQPLTHGIRQAVPIPPVPCTKILLRGSHGRWEYLHDKIMERATMLPKVKGSGAITKASTVPHLHRQDLQHGGNVLQREGKVLAHPHARLDLEGGHTHNSEASKRAWVQDATLGHLHDGICKTPAPAGSRKKQSRITVCLLHDFAAGVHFFFCVPTPHDAYSGGGTPCLQ